METTPAGAGLALGAPDELDAARRFGGVIRLYGEAAFERFRRARVCVIGLGGVGSWAVEAFARSGIGQLTLVDLDHIAVSNVNRQIHAVEPAFGQSKVGAMSARVRDINASCDVCEVDDFVSPDNVVEILAAAPDFVVDCIDHVRAKAALIAHCRAQGLAMVTCGAAGGQFDPTRIQVRDLARTEQEPLLAKVRRLLRAEYGFPRNLKSKFGIEAVFSDEPLRYPEAAACDVDATPAARSGLACAGFGSSVCVTASFGLVAASRALAHLAAGVTPPAE